MLNLKDKTSLQQVLSNTEYWPKAASAKIDFEIKNSKTREVILSQKDVEVPAHWGYNSQELAVGRWMRGKIGTEERETSIFGMFSRVASAISGYGRETGRLTEEEATALYEHLMYLQVFQVGVFNTPVYLNAGWTKDPRCSACFLIWVEDNFESLTKHGFIEGKVFQQGGGAGTYIGHISHEGRQLGRGGFASGPLPFNEGWDRSSGAIKSGGSHRRAARDITMDVRHPDCYRSPEYLKTLPNQPHDIDFIREKQVYEEMRRDLGAAGRESGINSLVDYILPAQNSNRAVGIFDDFMRAKNADAMWDVCDPRSGRVVWSYPAREIWDTLCKASWACAEPTIKFYDTINDWNTTPNIRVQGREFKNVPIRVSNPCFSGKARLLTNVGYLSFEELERIEENSPVRAYDHRGNLRTFKVRKTGKKDIYRVNRDVPGVADREQLHSIFCTEEHLFLCGNTKTFKAAQLQGKQLTVPSFTIEHNDIRGIIGGMLLFSASTDISDVLAPVTDAGARDFFECMYRQVSLTYGIQRVAELFDLDMELPVAKRTATAPTDKGRKFSALRGVVFGMSSVTAFFHKDGEVRFVLPTREHAQYVRNVCEKIDVFGYITEGTKQTENGEQEDCYMFIVDGLRSLHNFHTFVGFADKPQAEALFKHLKEMNPKVTDVTLWESNRDVFDFSFTDEETGNVQGGVPREFFGVVDGAIAHNCNEVIHTVPPISEALIACNLAMLKLTEYVERKECVFDTERFRRDAAALFISQDFIVDYSDYPTEIGKEWTRACRIIGLSLSDLGGMLMSLGLPYDSDEGRDFVSAVVALLLANSMHTSTELAEKYGACDAYGYNKEPMDRCVKKHRDALHSLCSRLSTSMDDKEYRKLSKGQQHCQRMRSEALRIAAEAAVLMDSAMSRAESFGYRNMQFLSMAPQGTTGLITNCDGLGIEPIYALTVYKTLAGGGLMEFASENCIYAVSHLIDAYKDEYNEIMQNRVDKHAEDPVPALDPIALADELRYGKLDHEFWSLVDNEDMKCIETAAGITINGEKGRYSLTPAAHIKMLAAIQPFISGASSKTVNVPSWYTPEDMGRTYDLAWELGVKALAVYRDGSKGAQVIKTSKDDEDTSAAKDVEAVAEFRDLDAANQVLKEAIGQPSTFIPRRRKLNSDAPSVRHELRLAGHKVYMNVSLYDNGDPAEVFLTGPHGSFLSGMLDSFAIMLSLAFQFGIPFADIYRKFETVEFPPNGMVPGIGFAASFPSLVVKTIQKGLDSGTYRKASAAFLSCTSVVFNEELDYAADTPAPASNTPETSPDAFSTTGEPCSNCGGLMLQSGRCKTCTRCGFSSGGCS